MPDTFTIRWARVLGMAAIGVLIFGMMSWAAAIYDGHGVDLLPACLTEDQVAPDCYWYSESGMSFHVIDAVVYFEDGTAVNIEDER